MPQITSNGATTRAVPHTSRTLWIAKTALLAAIATLLMYIECPLPLMPPFLKFDVSDVPAFLAAFSLGPLSGVLVQIIKNVVHLAGSQTGMVGEMANAIVGSAFVVVAGLIYRRIKTRRGALLGLGAGTLALMAVGALMNYLVLLPFYISVMGIPLEAIVKMVRMTGNTLVCDMPSLILYVFVPFNLIKGVVVSLIVLLIYKRLSPLLHR